MSWLSDLESFLEPEKVRNATHTGDLFTYLFPNEDELIELELGDELTPSVEYSLFIQVGRPKSGKTTSSLTIAALVEDYFRRLRTRTVVSPSLPNCLRMLPGDTEVGVLIVDDAPVLHPAYGGRKFADALNVATYFMMRHLARKSAPSIKYMLVVFNTQRFWSLDVAFREASDADLFKSMVKEPREKKYLRRYLGRELFNFLRDLHREVFYRRNRDALRYFVYYTTWDTRGVGVFDTGPLRPSNLTVDTKTKEDMLERLFGLAGEYSARGLALKILEALGRLGAPWKEARNVLDLMRDLGVKIANDVAHKTWRRGYESRVST